MEVANTPYALVDTIISAGINSAVIYFSPSTKNSESLEKFLFSTKKASIRESLIEPVPVWENHIPEALIQNLHGSSSLPKHQTYHAHLVVPIFLTRRSHYISMKGTLH